MLFTTPMRTACTLLALPLLAVGQALMSGPGGTINSPTFNETLITCKTILFPLNVTGLPPNVAAVTLQLVGDGKIPPTYNWDGDIFVPYNGTVIENIPFPSQFSALSPAGSGHYYLEVNEWAVNCTGGAPFRYTLQGQVNIVNNGFNSENCSST